MAKNLKELRESVGTATAIGSAPRRTPFQRFSKSSLGGNNLKRRTGAQKSGNQQRTPNIYEEIVKKVKEKMPAGKTATNMPADTVDTNVKMSPTNGY